MILNEWSQGIVDFSLCYLSIFRPLGLVVCLTMPEALFGSDSSYSFSDRKRAKGNKLSMLEAEEPVSWRSGSQRQQHFEYGAVTQVAAVQNSAIRLPSVAFINGAEG